MNGEQIGKPSNPDRLPLKQRMAFQVLLMKNMIGQRPEGIPEKDWMEKGAEWSSKYTEMVSDIIDNPANTEMRALVLSERYQEAIEMIRSMLL